MAGHATGAAGKRKGSEDNFADSNSDIDYDNGNDIDRARTRQRLLNTLRESRRKNRETRMKS